MATISADKDWNKYVKNNPNSATINYPIENGINNEPIYSSTTIKTAQVLVNVSTGDTVKITQKTKVSIGNKSYAKVKFNNKTGYLRATAIRKPTGSTGADAEQRTLELTNNTIRALSDIAKIGRGNRTGIDIEVPGVGMFIGITNVEKVSNRIHGREAKADFKLKNALGRGILFISHKDGAGPKAFQQYGGISETSGSIDDNALIYNNPEVKSFLDDLYDLYDDAINKGRTQSDNPFDRNGNLVSSGVSRPITNSTLINQSVYGPSFGGTKGPDNVHLIGQGSFVFTPLLSGENDLYFRLSFSGHMALNGDVSDFANDVGGYRAVLCATKRSRSTKTSKGTINGIRVGIFPEAIRPNARMI